MRILLLGSGGREHALAAALARDPMTELLLIAPGNPGTAAIGQNLDLDPCDPDAVVTAARQYAIDLVVVGPEAPLVAGVSDALIAADIAVFGPTAEAAQLESSKAFAKDVMAAADIPTAMARYAETLEEAEAALDAFGAPYVVKNDALAAGKGVIVTDDRDTALAHAKDCLAAEGGAVLIEDYLDGPEVSLFCVCDGTNAIPLIPAQDFKRVGEGDEGPNTGGMGAYAPLPWLPDGVVDEIVQRVAQPALAEMKRRGTPFTGLLYCGLALTSRGLRVVEFNARFGDPETQAVLELLASSLPELLYAAATGRLDTLPSLRWKPGAAIVVVLASEGYPGTPVTGGEITGVDAVADKVRHAGTALRDGRLVSSGGRVLGVVGTGDDIAAAREDAYAALAKISLAGSHFRRDIAKRADHIVVPEAARPRTHADGVAPWEQDFTHHER
ncbi:phosphoribosylamine--glycine ligase [Bowdeniella nasicola]|uniref:Phosphoribosylamine--glycine ligase n=1 Tax=Bowdeniella nasicola TaxID=208480 RepID=A0A1Q5Q1G4_9ACTO|nr:phosphoribosylamine--glycine ligase [Bowdeniella nasicola]OKL53657.1 phosphoribosylamine--glycine ligase [Bowdeniella nasicola]